MGTFIWTCFVTTAFLCGAYFSLFCIARMTGRTMRKFNHVWTAYRDEGDALDNTQFAEYRGAAQIYGLCLLKLIPWIIVITPFYFYISRVPAWFYTQELGQIFIARMNENRVFQKLTVWSVRAMFLLAYILPLLRETRSALAFPAYYLKNSEKLRGRRDYQAFQGVIYTVLIMDLIALLILAGGYDSMIRWWG